MDKPMMPDFLIIPYQVIEDERVRPFEERVYAIVYWFRAMRLERCTAKNETIALYARTTVRMVQRALENLEEYGYIERKYDDEGERVDIIPLVTFRAATGSPVSHVPQDVPHVLQDTPPRPTGRGTNKENITEKNSPPVSPPEGSMQLPIQGMREPSSSQAPIPRNAGASDAKTSAVSSDGVKKPVRAGNAPMRARMEYLDTVPSEDIAEWTRRFAITEKQIRSTAESLKLYCERKGKRYKDYKAFLLSAIKRDYPEKQETTQSKYAHL